MKLLGLVSLLLAPCSLLSQQTTTLYDVSSDDLVRGPVSLKALSTLTPAADKLPYFTSGTAAANTDFSAFARTLLDDADNTAARSTLGLVIGTNVQAYDADLTTWAGITPGTGVGTALAVNVGTVGAFVVNGGALGTPSSGVGTNLTALNATQLTTGTVPTARLYTTAAGYNITNGAALDALGAVASNGGLYRTAASTYTARTITGTAGQITVTNGDGVSGAPTISLPSSVTLVPSGSTPAIDVVAAVDTGFSFFRLRNTAGTAQSWDVSMGGSNTGATSRQFYIWDATAGAKRLSIAPTTGDVTIGSTTASTNTASGALIVGANVGLSGNSGGPSYFGGNGFFAGSTFRVGTLADSNMGVRVDQSSVTVLKVQNASSGTAANTRIIADNGAYGVGIEMPGGSFTTSGPRVANRGYVYSDGAAGMTIHAVNSVLRFWTGNTGTERMTIDGSGVTTINGIVAVNGATASSTTALITTAGTTGVSSLRIPHGAAPTSPVDGDIWTTTAGIFVRINGATVGPL